MIAPSKLPPELEELAARCNVVTAYKGTDGNIHQPGVDTVRAVLASLGIQAQSEKEVRAALAERRDESVRTVLTPVVIGRSGSPSTIPLRLTPGAVGARGELVLELEDGTVWRHALSDLYAPGAGSLGGGSVDLARTGWPAVEPGYHSLTVETAHVAVRARYIVAPRCPRPARAWGAFMPLHALRTDADWGIGSYSDLAELTRWIAQLGGAFVGTLPLYPLTDRAPFDPSPYLPSSRLTYNDLFIDPTTVPELASTPEAREILESGGVAAHLARSQSKQRVDYEYVRELMRRVLEPMSQRLMATPSDRLDAVHAFAESNPELASYARFCAEREGSESTAYHLYAQWIAREQLSLAAHSGVPLYADLPIGVRSDGFDSSWAPQSFAAGVHGGAPPDAFFTGGQDWGFRPLHPEAMREDGYDYLIACLRRACRHAAFLRVDHAAGLHRLYWIPEGMQATEGAYVSYHSEELRALVCLEAHRAGTVIVGEDLGTVPDEVRADMAEDGMLRSWVMQFESTAETPLPEPPAGALASWSTHDLPRFTTYFEGADLAPEAIRERASRTAWRHALVEAVGTDSPSPDGVLRRCLTHMARSPAALVMVDLEELWGERLPQNSPGTGPDAGNWRQRSPVTLDEMRHDRLRTAFLASLRAGQSDSKIESETSAALETTE
jgi:4-alpha-glucanotransferase